MNRRHFLSTICTAATGALTGSLPTLAQPPEAPGSRKKGWAGANGKFHQLVGAHWYYTWSPKTRSSKAIEFVPMIKGPWSLKQSAAIKQMGGISHLLGFNEPEREKQGDVSVADAVRLWPKLEALAKEKKLRLGGPACSGESGLKWIRSFMEQAKDKGLHMDFMTIHYYRLDTAGLERLVDNLADNYKLPIWVTEFNGWTGDESANYKFLKESLKFLERARQVERYAYMNGSSGKPQDLVKQDGTLNRMGELYREAGT